MKTISGLILLLYSSVIIAQGNDCINPYVLDLDGICRDYTISSTPGTALHCTNSAYYSGTGVVTIFSFKTNSTGSCVLINLTTSDYQPAEVMLFAGCTGGGSLHFPDDASSVCFDDGTGLWAPSETFVLSPGTVYYLRVWTLKSGTITMCAKNYDPPNNDCAGATPIGPTPIADNNACHKPGQGVTPDQLCAFSLENTAFYSYTTQSAGSSMVTIANIACDNSAIGGSSGFQIGFFTGSCGSLIPINCYSDIGMTVQATTNSMPAGSQIIVAIDGMQGSNCSYTISAINAIVLAANLKYFSAWMKPAANALRWLTLNETNNTYFDIEKSSDGIHFLKIGTVAGKNHSNTETDYSFEDAMLAPNQFYRLKIIGENGNFMYSHIVQVKRPNLKTGSVIFENPVSNKLIIKVNTPYEKNTKIQIIDVLGRQRELKNAKFDKGENIYTIDTHSLPSGLYYLIFSDNNSRAQYSFIKE